MTLHEAIKLILIENNGSLSAREIADKINDRKLYLRADKVPVPSSQISARVNNYPNLFASSNGKINLVEKDEVSLGYQKIRNEIAHTISYSNLNYEERIQLLIDKLKKYLNIDNEDDTNNTLNEPKVEYVQDSNQNFNPTLSNDSNKKFLTAYQLIEWIAQQNHKVFNIVFSENFYEIIAGLNWFEKGAIEITPHIQNSIHFLLKIAIVNKYAQFHLKTTPSIIYDTTNKELSGLNSFVSDLINKSYKKGINIEENQKVAIIIPPFYYKKNQSFEPILNIINASNKAYNKALIIAPMGQLFSAKAMDVDARKQLIKSQTLESVISLPDGMMRNAGIKLSLLLFNFSKPNKEVYFLDATAYKQPNEVSKHINNKKQLSKQSMRVGLKEIKDKSYSLLPNEYLKDTLELTPKKGETIYQLKDLVISKAIGKHVNQEHHNSWGEYKLIRTSVLDNNATYLPNVKKLSGVDHDLVEQFKYKLVSDGIVISEFSKNLKYNVLPKNEKFVLSAGVFWLKLKSNIILEEYLINEFKKEYVQDQVHQLTKGSVIPRIALKDLLKINFLVPGIDEQKNCLLENIRISGESDSLQQNNDQDADFIKLLQHTLRQPFSGFSNDFSSLNKYLQKKNDYQESLSFQDTITPVFPDDTPEMIETQKLHKTLERIQRAINDMEYILDKADEFLKAETTHKVSVNIKELIHKTIEHYPNLHIEVSGPEVNIDVDRSQLRYLLNNFIENAKKHGFNRDIKNPTIWIEIVDKKDQHLVEIAIRNNGKALPSEFTIENFLAKSHSGNEDIGSGFGGYLIGRIIKNHRGDIQLTDKNLLDLKPYNIEFLITLPK